MQLVGMAFLCAANFGAGMTITAVYLLRPWRRRRLLPAEMLPRPTEPIKRPDLPPPETRSPYAPRPRVLPRAPLVAAVVAPRPVAKPAPRQRMTSWLPAAATPAVPRKDNSQPPSGEQCSGGLQRAPDSAGVLPSVNWGSGQHRS